MNKVNSSSIDLAEISKGYIEIPELKSSNIEIESKVHLHLTSKKIIKNINFENNIILDNKKNDFIKIETNYKSSIIIENCDFKEFLIDSFKGSIKFVIMFIICGRALANIFFKTFFTYSSLLFFTCK